MRSRALAGMTALALLAGGCGGSEPSPPPAAGGGTPPGAPASPGASAGTSPGGVPSRGAPSGRNSPGGSGPASASPGAVVMNGVRPGAEKKSDLDGTWTAGSGGDRVRLYLYRGAAALNSPEFCTGTVDASGRIKLTCAEGAGKRVDGKAVLRADTLTVRWASGISDTLRRT